MNNEAVEVRRSGVGGGHGGGFKQKAAILVMMCLPVFVVVVSLTILSQFTVTVILYNVLVLICSPLIYSTCIEGSGGGVLSALRSFRGL